MNILIAEDAQETRDVLKNIISYGISDEAKLFEAENGKEALDIIKNNHIDILLTDIMMPIMDGFELIKSVKEDDTLKDIFVAAITGLSGEEQVKKVFACGADYYIPKPIQQEDIIARLKLIYKLVSKSEQVPEYIRDTFNPFETSFMMNYYTIFTIYQEHDLYQIIHNLIALHPKINKIMLKDFITILLISYEQLEDDFESAFEVIVETSHDAAYLSCTHASFINAIQKYKDSLPSEYEIKNMRNSITIKIPTIGE